MISFVYFDVGGVLMLDFSGTNKWNDMLRDLGIQGEIAIKFNEFWKQHRREIATGQLDLPTVVEMAKQELNLSIPQNYSMMDYFIQRFELNPSMHPVVKSIHKKTRIGLLTDMYVDMFDEIVKANLLPKEQWEIIIDSSKVHYKKPDKEIFALAQQRTGVPNDQIFFVDNVKENVEAAKDYGWNVFHYNSVTPEVSSQQLLTMFLSLTS